jgi:hypothetical protein
MMPLAENSLWMRMIGTYQYPHRDGWCWWYRKYAPGDTVLEGLERDAREPRKGLWVDPQPVPPWERRMK